MPERRVVFFGIGFETTAPANLLPTFNFKQAISLMVQRNGSDLHLKIGRPPTMRLNGELTAMDLPPLKRKAIAELSYGANAKVSEVPPGPPVLQPP